MIEEFARLLFKQVKLADEELAVALLFASITYFADFFFFPGGMNSATAACWSAVFGFSLLRLLKNRRFFLKLGLRQIKEMEVNGELDAIDAQGMRHRLIHRWFENVYGLPMEPPAETKTIEPIKSADKE